MTGVFTYHVFINRRRNDFLKPRIQGVWPLTTEAVLQIFRERLNHFLVELFGFKPLGILLIFGCSVEEVNKDIMRPLDMPLIAFGVSLIVRPHPIKEVNVVIFFSR